MDCITPIGKQILYQSVTGKRFPIAIGTDLINIGRDHLLGTKMTISRIRVPIFGRSIELAVLNSFRKGIEFGSLFGSDP
ncbi:hypothetical protein X772_33085 [Mesorhizobium sp. LSJC280B00]|nr:hypothetical protein X772_33085 [Mesorhizobium sp. LSJC280B00]